VHTSKATHSKMWHNLLEVRKKRFMKSNQVITNRMPYVAFNTVNTVTNCIGKNRIMVFSYQKQTNEMLVLQTYVNMVKMCHNPPYYMNKKMPMQLFMNQP